MPEKGTCRSCLNPILWVRSATTGSLMPLDAEPCEDGNMTLVDGLAHVRGKTLFEEATSPDEARYKSHFATCPNSKAHWKIRGKP